MKEIEGVRGGEGRGGGKGKEGREGSISFLQQPHALHKHDDSISKGTRSLSVSTASANTQEWRTTKCYLYTFYVRPMVDLSKQEGKQFPSHPYILPQSPFVHQQSVLMQHETNVLQIVVEMFIPCQSQL